MNYQETFSFFQEKKLTYDFNGGQLSSDGGILLVREYDQFAGITSQIADCIRDDRDQRYTAHTMLDLIRERIYMITAGYEDCNDAKHLAHDPAFKVANDRNLSDPNLASQPTLSRWENTITSRDLMGMAEALTDHWLNSYKQPPKEIVLDFDSTDAATHGKQQMTLFHGYYDQCMYHPLIVSCNGQIILAFLRKGSSHASSKCISILKFLIKRIRKKFPKTRILFRGDAGFAIPRLFDYLESENIHYVIGLITNNVLKKTNAGLMTQAQKQYQIHKQKQRLFQEFQYQAGSWKKARRVIAKAEYMEEGENHRFVLTNTRKTPQILYDIFYCARGDSENWIKELKPGFRGDRLSCHRFAANQFRLLLSVTAYRLISGIKSLLKKTELATTSLDTLRLKLFKVAARVRESSRRIWFQFCSSYPYQNLFSELHKKILQLQI